MAMALGFAMVLAMCVLVCVYRENLSDESVMLACLLMLSGVPFFLPKMHERYTFGADVLALAVAAGQPPADCAAATLWPGVVYLLYGGLAGDTIMELKWATMFQAAGVALTAAALWRSLRESREAIPSEVKA